VSTVFHETDEAIERALFERRARARSARAGVPSLDAVLRAARQGSPETSGGRGRAWTGLALAAACLIGVMKTRSHEVSPAAIAADVDRAVSAGADRSGSVCEEQQESACSFDPTYASRVAMAPASDEGRACVAPPASFESFGTLSCGRDEAERTEMR
jgi:hypothetical protein